MLDTETVQAPINQDYTSSGDLIRAFRAAGMKTVNYQTINRWEKSGLLKFERFPISNHRAVPRGQINKIVRAFFPGGSGRWHYDKD